MKIYKNYDIIIILYNIGGKICLNMIYIKLLKILKMTKKK